MDEHKDSSIGDGTVRPSDETGHTAAGSDAQAAPDDADATETRTDAAVPAGDAVGPPQTRPGWYPDPDGGQRYWDGAKWLDIPAPDPRPDAAAGAAPSRAPRRGLIVGAVVTVLAVLILGGGLLAWKLVSDSEAARVAAEQVAEAERERQEEAERVAEREAAAERAAEAEAEAERAVRAASIPDIEASVKKMAEDHAADGIIEGPVLDVTCSPVDGGSIDDLTDLTTVFECFAATVDNGDGTMTGFTYNATMNWSDGTYTYGLGAP